MIHSPSQYSGISSPQC